MVRHGVYNKRKLYTGILLALIISVASVITISSAFLYLNFEKIGSDIIYSSEKKSLAQVSYSSNFMVESVTSLAMQLYLDDAIIKLMYDSSVDLQDIKTGLDRLSAYAATSPFIHSIYVYNDNIGKIYSTSSARTMNDVSSFFDNNAIHLIKESNLNGIFYKVIPRDISTYSSYPANEHFSRVITFIFPSLSGNASQLREAIVINVSEEWLRGMINSLNNQLQSDTFIIDDAGMTVVQSQKGDILDYIPAHIKNNLLSAKDSGFFIDYVGGDKSLITYVSANVPNWKFVSIIPYSNVMNKITVLQHKTVLIVVVILLCGFALSILISLKLYKPIDGILSELKALETKESEGVYALKHEFLHNLLLNRHERDLKRLSDKLCDYNIQWLSGDPFLIVVFRIDHYNEFYSQCTFDERNLLETAILKIISDNCQQYFLHECIIMDSGNVTLFLNLSKVFPDDINDSVYRLIKSIQSSIQTQLTISCSAAVSGRGTHVGAISKLYEQAVNASKYRLYYGHNSIVYADDICKIEVKEYSYPNKKEKQLIDALMLGKGQEAKKIYMQIIEDAKQYSYSSFQLTLLSLSSAMDEVINSIKNSIDPKFSFNFSAFYARFNKLETIEQINQQYFEIIDIISNNIQKSKIMEYNKLVCTIDAFIETNYKDPNLSINSLADAFNMSTNYLGRLYKKLTSKNIAERINETRITKAVNLLQTTSLNVIDIAKEVGFDNTNYFYTLFKKMYGITPNSYRKKYYNESTD